MNEKLAAAQISGGFERIYNKTKGWEITGLYHFCVMAAFAYLLPYHMIRKFTTPKHEQIQIPPFMDDPPHGLYAIGHIQRLLGRFF